MCSSPAAPSASALQSHDDAPASSTVKPSDPWGQRKASPASTSGSRGLRHARAYALSNGLPLVVGTICWAWMDRAGTATSAGLLHMALCQAFHLGAMLVMAVLYSHGRPRDTPAASWRSLRSPHGLFVADLLSHCVALSKRWSALPSFAPNHLASFFIVRLLLMELVFDFFHYCSHRLSHTIPALYTRFHKIHHSHHADLHVGSTLQMHPVDGVLTNTMPLLLAVTLIPIQSHWEFHVYMAYKTAQELFGHCGTHIKVKSFPSNPWLVEWLNMDLYIVDHTAHHVDGRCNFGKRLSFWDRVFGTFQRADTDIKID